MGLEPEAELAPGQQQMIAPKLRSELDLKAESDSQQPTKVTDEQQRLLHNIARKRAGHEIQPVNAADDDEFERVLQTLGLVAHRAALVGQGVVDIETLRDLTWNQLRECGVSVPVRNRVLAWQNEEVYVPRWSSGTFACFDDVKTCLVVGACPCYAYNIIYIEAEVQPVPCGLWGCAAWLVCLPFFPCMGFLARQHLAVKYRISTKHPRPSYWEPFEDFCCHLCCHSCSLCQELREIGHRYAGGADGHLATDLVASESTLMPVPMAPGDSGNTSEPPSLPKENTLTVRDGDKQATVCNMER